MKTIESIEYYIIINNLLICLKMMEKHRQRQMQDRCTDTQTQLRRYICWSHVKCQYFYA
jgi:hypothetical protein